MSHPRLYPATVLVAALPAVGAGAEVEQTVIETVVVTGSRLDQSVTEVGSSVTIIDSADIERLGFDFAVDALAAAPGVTVNQNGAFGGVASVRIRGAASEQTLVLIDGVPVNDPTAPGGGYDFARLDTENIERIEVLKGPQSTLWGTDAIGGVVAIRTKRPDEGLSGSVFAEYGSFNTFRGGASVGHAGERGDFRLATTLVDSDGISKADEDNGNDEDDAYESLTFSVKGGLNLPGDVRLDANLLWNDAETEFDSFDFGAQGSVGDGDERSDTDELNGNLTLRVPALDGRMENMLLVGYSEIERRNFTDGLPSFDAEGDRLVYRYQGTVAFDRRNTLAFGAEREEATANDDDTSIDGLFALYEFKPIESVTLTGGLRSDDHERFGSETTGRLAAAWQASEAFTLRASWGEGFKAPTIFQTTFFCCGASAPNADLRPETSEGYDLGLEWRGAGGRVEAGIAYFRQDTDNLIDFSFAAGAYENIAEAESEGIELHGAVRIVDWLTVTADYAYLEAEDGSGMPLARLPEHSGDLTVSFDPGGPFSGALLLRYNGEEANGDGTDLSSWTRVDLAGRFALSDRVELFGRVENLLDEDYQQVLGYGTPGLSGSVGVRMRY